MNIARTVEQLSSEQQQVLARSHPSVPPVTKSRHAPSSTASIVVALCFVCLFIGIVIFTSYVDRSVKSKPREPARNMPMVHLR
jgi:hypothetical protein